METKVERLLRRHLYFVTADTGGSLNDNRRFHVVTHFFPGSHRDAAETTLPKTEPPSAPTASHHYAVETPVSCFEVGKTYMMRSPGDHNCVWTYKVVARTQKSVTLLPSEGRPFRRCIKVYCGAEHCMPLGSYSLAPCLSAEKEVEP